MNLKYYLRGLGLGIVMTAIIVGIAARGKDKSLTEEEIVEKAKTLGMIEEEQMEEYLEEARAETEERIRKELAEEAPAVPAAESVKAEGSAGEENAGGREASGSQEMNDTREQDGSREPASDQDQEADDGTEPVEDVYRGEDGKTYPDGKAYPAGEDAAAADDRTKSEEGMEQEIIFNIKKGETPYSIGKRLEEEGLLPADANFDRFLVDNGYDMKIVASEYRIPTDADMETIAKIITKQDR